MAAAIGTTIACFVVLSPATVASPSARASAPIISKVTPNFVTRGDLDDVLVIAGTNFAPDASVFFEGGISVTSISNDSDAQITVHVRVADDASFQFASLVVSNNDGTVARTHMTVKMRSGPAVFRDGVWFARLSFTTGKA